MSFKINNGRGFQITLPNGWTVSVQFGEGHYGSNRDREQTPANSEFWEAKLAEIACFPSDGNGEWYQFPNEDEVKGWVTVAEFLEWLEVFKQLPPTTSNAMVTVDLGDHA